MARHKKVSFGIVLFFALTLVIGLFAGCESKAGSKGEDFSLIENDRAAVIVCEGTNAPHKAEEGEEWPGVARAAYDLQSDVEKITGVKPVVTKQLKGRTDYAVIVGTLTRSDAIDEIAALGKIDASKIAGKWESYIVKTVQDPFGDGSVKTALVVAGSDKRGTIYGIYSVSEMLGMTPWEFFADSVPAHRDNLVLASDFEKVGEEPDVQYRGIFINDEECLELWARSLDEGKHLGPNLYEKIFELLLRVKANYLWPGMHACSDAFSDYVENPVNADYYGIVIGTSHCDMLMRNNLNEWSSFVSEYKAAHPEYQGEIVYDYTVNPEIVREYWTISVRENKDYEVQWTLGMRGAHDEPFTASRINEAPWYGNKNMLMEQIIADQREILKRELNNPTLEDVFMMFIPYKEVQELYNNGLRIPDDVTIMWADDNHGFIRNVPNEAERARSGGLGVYYHNSYWGPDNESYMWVNSMPFTFVYEEMSKAYSYGVKKAWILNSGDTVPYMPEIEFFMDLGMRVSEYPKDAVYETYVHKMAEREFGAEFAEELTTIYKEYTQMTNVRKLEQMSVDLFSPAYGDEMERRAAQYKKLYDLAEDVYERIPARQRDCFYETILFEVRCAYYINAEFYYAHKGNVAYAQGRYATAHNAYNLSLEYNEMRKDELSYYNNILQGGKWKNLMDPENYHSPVMSGFASGSPAFKLGETAPGFIVEGESVEQADSVLTFENYAQGRKYIDVFNKGAGSFTFKVEADKDFVIIGDYDDRVTDEQRVWIEIDWGKLKGSDSATITITANGVKKEIALTAIVDGFELGEKTYVEQDGYVSIEAEHYSASRETPVTYWETIKDLGRVSGDMVRAVSKTLVGYGERSFEQSAPYLEYDVYFKSTGTFETEVYRLPSLNSLGRVRFAVSLGGGRPVIIEGERDYGTNNPAWEEGVFTQIIKHELTLTVEKAGLNKIRLYMLDPFITIDKLVVYTSEKQPSYFGPLESYNTTYNTSPAQKAKYDRFYESAEYVLPQGYDIARDYGTGAFVEQNGVIAIETEAAELGTQETGAWKQGRWLVARTDAGISMRTEDLREDFDSRWEEDAPTLNYKIVVREAGTYNLWLNLNCPSPRSSCYAIGVDGRYCFVIADFNWSREEVFMWRKSGVPVELSAGEHVFTVYCSQDGVAIDKLYLTRTNETPNNEMFVQSPRSGVTSSVEGALVDAAQRSLLAAAISEAGNYYNIVVGEGVGMYGVEARAVLMNALDGAYALLNATYALDGAEVSSAVSALRAAIKQLHDSRIMTDGSRDYLVYETYDEMIAGLLPYGFAFDSRNLTPDVAVKEGENGDKYFNIRAFSEQKSIESAFVRYDFAPQAQSLTMEARMSFNEAEWGSLYLRSAGGENAVCVAFEYAYNTYNIVAYDRGVKRVIASYERNVPVTVKVVADVAANTFDVYVDGELRADDFLFRSDAEEIGSVVFGSAARDCDLRMYELKVYAE